MCVYAHTLQAQLVLMGSWVSVRTDQCGVRILRLVKMASFICNYDSVTAHILSKQICLLDTCCILLEC